MKVSKREDFSLILMSALARQDSKKYISLGKIAKRYNLSPPFLKHIASDLKNHGLVKSKEGIDGGYKLSKSPKEITISEIINAVSGKVVTPSCFAGDCRIDRKNCSCFTLWNKVGRKLNIYLKKLTLFEISKM